jgi:hypothetical protein
VDSAEYPGNTGVGHLSLYSNVTGENNTAIGSYSLFSNQNYYNTATGSHSLYSNTTGGSNTASGDYSLYFNTSGGSNTATGSVSMFHNTAGAWNTATGDQSMYQNTIGYGNTSTGFNSLYSNTTGYYNTANGYMALGGNSTGIANTAVGCYADVYNNVTNATAIGYGATVNISNKVRIGNSAVTVIEGQVPFTTPSDGRWKYQVQEDVKGLDFILKLRPVTYQFDVKRFDAQQGNPQGKAGTEGLTVSYFPEKAYDEAAKIRRSGFIAQEVEQAAQVSGYNFSGLVTPKTAQEHYSLSYESFVVPLVKAVQEQQQLIDAQHEQIARQEKKIDAQYQQIERQDRKLADLQQQLDELKQSLRPVK